MLKMPYNSLITLCVALTTNFLIYVKIYLLRDCQHFHHRTECVHIQVNEFITSRAVQFTNIDEFGSLLFLLLHECCDCRSYLQFLVMFYDGFRVEK